MPSSLTFSHYQGAAVKHVTLPLPDDLAPKAKAIRAAGFFFALRETETRHLCLVIIDPKTENAVAQQYTANGPAVADAVTRLVTDFQLEK